MEPRLELLRTIAGDLERTFACKASEAASVASDMLAAILDGQYRIDNGTVRRVVKIVPQGEFAHIGMWNVYTRTDSE